MFVFHGAFCLLGVSETESRVIERMHSTTELINPFIHLQFPGMQEQLDTARWSFLLVGRVHMQLVYSTSMMDLCVRLISSTVIGVLVF